jgi:integrase
MKKSDTNKVHGWEKTGENKFRITVYGGYDPKGKQRKKKATVTIAPDILRNQKKLKIELDRLRLELQEEVDSDGLFDGRIRFTDFVDLWKERYALKFLKPTTIEFYDNVLRRILPEIGNVKLEDLNRRHIDNLYRDLENGGTTMNVKYAFIGDFRAYLKARNITQAQMAEKTGLSKAVVARLCKGENINHISYAKLAKHVDKELFTAVNADEMLSSNTLCHYNKVLNAIFEKAIKWGYMDRNLCKMVEHTRPQSEPAPYLDDVQLRLLFKLLEAEPAQFRTMITLLAVSGLRRGEIKGMKWEDVDYNTNTIHVRRELLYTRTKGVYVDDTCKTKSSVRSIRLPKSVFEMLKRHQIAQTEVRLMMGDRWTNDGWVFTNESGVHLHPSTITKMFNQFIKRHGLAEEWQGIHIHSLRHSNASLLLARDVKLPKIAQRLGHASPTITTSTYIHPFESSDDEAVDVLEEILNA